MKFCFVHEIMHILYIVDNFDVISFIMFLKYTLSSWEDFSHFGPLLPPYHFHASHYFTTSCVFRTK